MILEEYFPDETDRKNAGRLIKVFHDDILLDESVSDIEAAVLVVYMIANKEKKNSTNKKTVQELFERLGRNGTRFSKAVYEAVNRKKPALLKDANNIIGLTFSGREFVEKILSEGEFK